jgi:hypothetical protein
VGEVGAQSSTAVYKSQANLCESSGIEKTICTVWLDTAAEIATRFEEPSVLQGQSAGFACMERPIALVQNMYMRAELT